MVNTVELHWPTANTKNRRIEESKAGVSRLFSEQPTVSRSPCLPLSLLKQAALSAVGGVVRQGLLRFFLFVVGACSETGKSSTPQPVQQTQRQPGDIRDEQHADREDAEHWQRGPRDLEHRLLEAYRGEQQIQTEWRMQEAELQVRDEDDPEVHVVNAVHFRERQDQRDDNDDRREDVHQRADEEQEDVETEQEHEARMDVGLGPLDEPGR